MGTLTIIIGLCASGKSHLLQEKIQKAKYGIFVKDEGFMTEHFEGCYRNLKAALENDIDAVLAGGEFCYKNNQEIFETRLREDFEDIEINWIAFENDLEKANNNVKKRKNKEDVDGHIEINSRLTKNYHFPENYQLREIFVIE